MQPALEDLNSGLKSLTYRGILSITSFFVGCFFNIVKKQIFIYMQV